jgi:hypothetical protein
MPEVDILVNAAEVYLLTLLRKFAAAESTFSCGERPRDGRRVAECSRLRLAACYISERSVYGRECVTLNVVRDPQSDGYRQGASSQVLP